MRLRQFCIAAVLCTSVLLLLVPRVEAAPHERKVFLNGVDLAGVELPEAVFKKCTVKLDKHGNIHITAPGVQLEADKTAKKRTATRKTNRTKPRATKKHPPTLTQRYFLVTRGKRASFARYDVTVYINGKRFTTLRSSAPHGAVEITPQLRPGDNTIELLAKKNGVKSGSAQDVFEIQIAEGDVKKGNAEIKSTVLTYRRTAAELASFRDQYRLTTR